MLCVLQVIHSRTREGANSVRCTRFHVKSIDQRVVPGVAVYNGGPGTDDHPTIRVSLYSTPTHAVAMGIIGMFSPTDRNMGA
jgi:hypothetical protein